MLWYHVEHKELRLESVCWLSLAVGRVSEIVWQVKSFGVGQNTGETLPNFRQKSKENLKKNWSKKGKKVICARHSPGVGHAQDLARIPKWKLGRVLSIWYQSIGFTSCRLHTLCILVFFSSWAQMVVVSVGKLDKYPDVRGWDTQVGQEVHRILNRYSNFFC